MPVNSRNKGKVGERELAKELTQIFGVECRRGQQFSGIDGRDVVGLEGVHIECKRVEKLNIDNAMDQATRDCGDACPAVFHRRNGKPWIVSVKLEDLLRFAGQIVKIKEKQ